MTDEENKEQVEKEVSEPQQESSSQEKPEFEKKLEEIRKENERMEKNITQMKELKAIEALGGKTEGKQPEKKDEDVTPEKIGKDLEKVGW